MPKLLLTDYSPSLSTHRLTLKEYLNYARQVVALGEQLEAPIQPLPTLLLRLKAHLTAIDQTSLTDSGSQVETLLKSDLDAQRDELYLGFKNTIDGARRHFDDNWKKAAQLLHAIIEDRPAGLHSLPYAANTAELDLLFAALEKPEAKTAVETLGLTGWLEALRQANENFKEQERKTTRSTLEAPSTINRSLFRSLQGLLRIYLGLLHFGAYEEMPGHGKILNQTEDVISSAQRLSRTRRTLAVNEDKPAETEGASVP